MNNENIDGVKEMSNSVASDSAIPTIEEMNLSERSFWCLKRAGIDTTEELLKCTFENILKVKNLNRKCVDEIVDALKQRGMALAEKDDGIGYYKSDGDYYARKERVT